MMMPWIINGVMRAIVGSLLFFVMFAFPIGSGAQVFFFFSHGIYYGEFSVTIYFLTFFAQSGQFSFSNDCLFSECGVLQLHTDAPNRSSKFRSVRGRG
jgi:hypothetical protein